MSERSHRALQQAIAFASAAATDAARWQDFVDAVSAATSAAGSALFCPDPGPMRGPIALNGTMRTNYRDYWNHWIHQDPWNEGIRAKGNTLFQQAGEIRVGREFVSDDDFKRTAYYDGHGRLYDSGHKLVLKVSDATDQLIPITHLTLNRSFRQQPFGEAERAALAELWPHLRQAIRAYVLLDHLRLPDDLAQSALEQLPLPALIVRDDRYIEFANAAGRALLDGPSLCRVACNRLMGVGTADEDALQQLVSQAAQGSGGHHVVAYLQGETLVRVTLRVVPIKDTPLYAATWPNGAALVLLELPQANDDRAWVREHVGPTFGLTPAEIRVYELVVRGLDRDAIAAKLGTTPETVRTHLRNLRKKTGRRSQLELVRLGLGR